MAINTLPTTNEDQPHQALTAGAIVRLGKDAVSAWVEDFAPSMGAAISYYTVFSIAPLLLIVIELTGFLLGHYAESGKIAAELEGPRGG